MDESVHYDILICSETLKALRKFKKQLEVNPNRCGKYLQENMKNINLKEASDEEFLTLLLKTKKPYIMSTITKRMKCDGSDWCNEEVHILGEVSLGVKVTIFDNGVWNQTDSGFQEHQPPIEGHLVFVCGALLSNKNSPDISHLVDKNEILFEKYLSFMKRRLVPAFDYVNNNSTSEKKALVTIPGIGCGVFAGKFSKILPDYLYRTLKLVLSESPSRFENIHAVVFVHIDGEETSENVNSTVLRRMPFTICKKPLLCRPEEYVTKTAKSEELTLFKLVAWDPVSLPGNNFFRGKRQTDDGVSSAATNCMMMICGEEGIYDKGAYRPPKGFDIWEDVVKQNDIYLRAGKNLRVARAGDAH